MSIALEFFVQYAYAILFLWVLVEMIGLPIPSVPVLLTAGTLSATHPARINGFVALAVVLAACLIAGHVLVLAGKALWPCRAAGIVPVLV